MDLSHSKGIQGRLQPTQEGKEQEVTSEGHFQHDHQEWGDTKQEAEGAGR